MLYFVLNALREISYFPPEIKNNVRKKYVLVEGNNFSFGMFLVFCISDFFGFSHRGNVDQWKIEAGKLIDPRNYPYEYQSNPANKKTICW